MPVLQRGCVKSVQRGYRVVGSREINKNDIISINISPINPNKSFVLIDIYEADSGYTREVFFNLLQSSIVIGATNDVNVGFTLTYQVVEFY